MWDGAGDGTQPLVLCSEHCAITPTPVLFGQLSLDFFGPLWIFPNALILISVTTSPKTLLADKVTVAASGKWTSLLGGHHSMDFYNSSHISSFRRILSKSSCQSGSSFQETSLRPHNSLELLRFFESVCFRQVFPTPSSC